MKCAPPAESGMYGASAETQDWAAGERFLSDH